jgi:hypothetical protein
MVKFSKSWIQAFRSGEDTDDFDIRAELEGERPDDKEWWNSHAREIGFFFTTLQELDLGYFKRDQVQGGVIFCTRAEFRRFLLKRWEPFILDI